ncbi:MAG: beta strand repeat-containing protein, partial [Alphaproteobacteria bacterium]
MATPDGTTVVGTAGHSGTSTGSASSGSTAGGSKGETSLDSLVRAFYDAIASTDPAAVRTSADALIDIKTGEALADGMPPNLAKQAAESYVAELLRGLSSGLPIEVAMQSADNAYAGAVAAAQAQMDAAAGDNAVTDLIQAMASGKGIDDAVDHAHGSQDNDSADASAKAAQDAFIQGLTEALADGLKGDAAIAFAAERATAVLEASQGDSSADALMQALSSGEGVEATMARLMGDTTQGMDPAAAAAARAAFQRGLAQALDHGSQAESALSDAATISNTAASVSTAMPADPAWALASGANVDSIIQQIVGTDGMTPDQIAAATRAFQDTLSSSLAAGSSADQAMRSAENAASTASSAADASGGDPLLQALANGQNIGQVVGNSAFANAMADALSQGAGLAAATQAGNAAASTAQTLGDSGTSDLLTAMATGQDVQQAINTAMGGGGSADATRAFEASLGNNMAAGSSANDAMQTASAASNTAGALSGQGSSGLNAIASGNTGPAGGSTGGNTQTASDNSGDDGLDMDAIAAAIARTETAAGGNTGQGGSGSSSNSGSSGGSSGSGSSGGYSYSNPFTSGGSTGPLSGGGGNDPLYTPPSSGSTGSSSGSSGSSSSSSSNTTAPANIAPTATADNATGHENQILTIPILGNDSDPDGSGVSLVSATLVSGTGTIQTPGGQLVYDPGTTYDYLDDGDTATVTVRYVIQDSAGAQASTTATILVTGTNDAPVVALAAIAEDEDVTIDFSAAQFSGLFSDVDANDTLVKIQITTLPTQGTLQLRGVDVTLNQEIATADLDGLTYVPGTHNNGSDSFEWKGSDGTVYSADAARFDLTLGPVNDAPTVSDPTVAPVVNEDSGILIGGISIDDVDAAEGDGIVTVTFAVDKGSVAISTGIPGGITPDDIQAGENGTGSVTVTASLAAIRATLADAEGLSYRTAPGDDTDAALTITVDDRGNSGSGGPLTTTKVIPIDVVPVSDPPVLTTDYAPLAATIRVVQPIASGTAYDHHYLKDIQVTVNGQAVAHSIDLGTGAQDLGGGIIETATGTYREFFIRFEAPAEADIALSFDHQAGDEDPDASREGLRFDLQVGGSDYATLADRSSDPAYVPGNNQPSSYAAQSFTAHYAVQPDGGIVFSASQGLAGGPGSSVDLDYVENAIVPVDDTIAITDVDSSQLTAAQVSITGNFTAGEDFLFADVTGTAITASFDPATGVLSLTGADSVANYQQVLRSVAYGNASDAPNMAARTIAFEVSDAVGGAMTGTALTRTVTVESVNDAPFALVPPVTAQGNEDSDIPLQGIAVVDLDAGVTDISVTLTVGRGGLTLDTTVTGGLAADEITGNGSATVTLTGSVDQINATLGALNGVLYRGAVNFNGSDTLSVAVNDLGNSGSGGALSAVVQTMNITVDPVNDAPTATAAATATGNEDSDIAIAGISVADLDAGGADISVTLTVGQGGLTLDTTVTGGLAADEIAGNGTDT